MSQYRCPLGKMIPRQAATAEELDEMKQKAWHRQGILVIRPEMINDDLTKQLLINLGNELYGKRHGR